MKIKLLIISIAIALCLSAAPAMADYNVGTTNVTKLDGYMNSSTYVGEFTLYDISLTNSAYSSNTKSQDSSLAEFSFQTFCVELDEDVMPPFYINDVYVSTTGVTGSQARLGGINTNIGDPLDYMTAYLYTEFATGNLSNYEYSPGSDRASDAEQLQKAIWYIEEEDTTALTGKALDFYNEAVAAGWTDIGNVRVLNMYTTNSAPIPRQDLLYLLPVPGAVLLGILGLSVVGIKLRKYA